MIKQVANSVMRAVNPMSKRLLSMPRLPFATNPFNNPYGDKTTTNNISQQIKAGQFVTRNAGLNKFITRIYNTTALSILGALGGAWAGMSIPMLLMNPMPTAIVGGLVTIGSFLGVQAMRPKYVSENLLGVPGSVYKTENSFGRLALYSLGVMSLGLSASPLFAMMTMMNSSIITTSLGITLGIFGGASAIAYTMPKDKMLGYGRIFMGSLVGLIAMQLVGLGSAYFMGPNALSSLLFSIDTYAGIALFAGLIGYDTHVAIKEYENGNADHLGVSIQMLLNFWNILIRVMQIMSRMKGE